MRSQGEQNPAAGLEQWGWFDRNREEWTSGSGLLEEHPAEEIAQGRSHFPNKVRGGWPSEGGGYLRLDLDFQSLS